MATNTPAKHPNVARFLVGTGEIPFSFDGIVTVIGFKVQAALATAIRMSFEAGGTLSGDNYWTIKSGHVYEQTDINWTPPENALYFRLAQGSSTVEVEYWG